MINDTEALYLEAHSAPTSRLLHAAVAIGREAWSDRFIERSIDQVAKVFDTDATWTSMRRAARFGKFAGVVAIAHDGETYAPVGVAWGAEDVSGTLAQRLRKHYVYPRNDYAWLAQCNVHPRYQDQRIGASMVDAFLQNFRPEQRPTTYVFDENQPTLRWFRDKLRYQPVADEPAAHPEYFGADAAPAQQWSLRAPSVASVRSRIKALYGPLPVDGTWPR